MEAYLLVKWIHVLSSTLLFGTGIGTAFYLFFISRTRDARVVAVVARAGPAAAIRPALKTFSTAAATSSAAAFPVGAGR